MKRREAVAKLVETAKEWPEGVDTTGRGLAVPAGHICIFDFKAAEYESQYVVKQDYPIEHRNDVVFVTLVDLTHTRNQRSMSMCRGTIRPVTHQSNANGCLDPEGGELPPSPQPEIPIVLDGSPSSCAAGFYVRVRPKLAAGLPTD